ncbi:MAG: hypothetical protein RSE00_02890 [Clostridia bacterium]
MSKLYIKYLELKQKENQDIKYLFKSGIFYIFLDEDAKEISKLLNLKLTNLNECVLKCGFPANNLAKYVNLLNQNNIEFKIMDQNLEKVSSLDKYMKNEDFYNAIKKIQKLDINNITPKRAYDIIYEFNLILKEIEV